ncbi:N-formylglutamate amidohydrolase [Rhizobium cauense]|uniref:N-formylglutamate amidohydrolase n=1 Tax=Rhizobium cauense TaxID=1166683 RepID=UPI001C6DDF9B|nr:N-formylglutamate amidohydrolase [Rhizobium cauense]MBW9115650.1 N-formylglutamate amidohydrolase [Rhizobium cauense]
MSPSFIRPSIPNNALWTVERGASPIVATAIHEGHHVRQELVDLYALAHDERLREEDPFTEFTTRDVPNRIVFHRSRFEVDLNRSREGAIYHTPEQAWGLRVWRTKLAAEHAQASLQVHDDYYDMLLNYLSGVERRYGRFVVLDIHSYNHRRNGAGSVPTEQSKAPDVNIGTSSMDRTRWAHIVDPLMVHFRSFEIDGRPLDVRENVAFQGKGEQTRFIHENFPLTGCAIAVEFKKIFMDEWTGEPDLDVLTRLRAIIASVVPVLEHRLMEGP